MITAKNYAAQAERDLRGKVLDFLRKSLLEDDSRQALKMADTIKSSVHFVLPDGGIIFDDGLRGIRGQSIRLPYRSITVEYYVKDHVDSGIMPIDCVEVSKRLVIATEFTVEEASRFIGSNSKLLDGYTGSHVISISAVFYRHGVWVPYFGGWLFTQEWDNVSPSAKQLTPLSRVDNGVLMSGTATVIMQGLFGHAVKEVGRDMALRSIGHDIGGEVCAVLELCEALTCKNVSMATFSSANAKISSGRLKRGKTPIYETKMLVVNTEKPTTSASSSVENKGTHASPRQHLRRGHIRRLPTGNIWVNSCVVGCADNGRIDKGYVVL